VAARQTYFISTQNTNFYPSVYWVIFGLKGAGVFPASTFSPSPYIQQFASYYLSSNGQWISPTTPASENTNYLFLGPNFQFQYDPDSTAPWINLNFEESSIVSSSPTGYGFDTGTADVPGWTVYYGWGDVNYSGGAILIYNNQPLDSAGASLEGTNYWTPAIGGNYSILLQGGTTASAFYGTNGASIGQTGPIPLSAQSITYWGSSWSSLRITFNGHLLSFFPVKSATNHVLYAADISPYAGERGELLFTAPWPNGAGMVDNIRFNSSPIPRPTLQIHYSSTCVTISWEAEYNNWVLEASTIAGLGNNWSTVTNTPTVTALQISITDTLNNASRFYRLRSQ